MAPMSGSSRSLHISPMGIAIIAAILGGLGLMAAVLGLLIPAMRERAARMEEERYWEENRPRLIALKTEAEKLALAGKLAEAHVKYQQIEQIAAGRQITHSAMWDLTERAKQDQDQIYRALLQGVVAQMERPATREAVAAPPPVAAAPPVETIVRPVPQVLPPVVAATAPAPVSVQPRVEAKPVEPATQPAIRPIARVTPAGAQVSDEQIGQAITRAVDYLLKHFKGDQVMFEGHANDTKMEGINALCVYALLAAGQATKDERLSIANANMRNLIGRMKEHQYAIDPANRSGPVTYAHSMRAAALAMHNRSEDRRVLAEDVRWMIEAATDGAYTYDDKAGRIARDRLPRFIGPEGSGAMYHLDPRPPGKTWQHNGEWYTPNPGGQITPPKGGIPAYRMGAYQRLADAYRERLYAEAPQAPWDNSNTQYGLLGVWAGAEAGIEVPIDYWLAAEQHWIGCQGPTGQWMYNRMSMRPSYSMTVAGVASLFVTHDYLDAPALGAEVGRDPFGPALARGLAFLEQGENCVDIQAGGMQYLGYNLFGIERVGLASGFKYFGAHDWFRELAAKALDFQRPDGSWGRLAEEGESELSLVPGSLIDTAFTILFLSRGRHPILFNKLRFDGYWNNRAREVANLSKYASRELERQLNWQVVSFEKDWYDWMDCPVLFISSHAAPKMSAEQLSKLKRFAEAGGLIFTHADGGGVAFNAFANELAKKLFGAELANVPSNHEIYSIQYRLTAKPPLKCVSNGTRLLMVHSPQDISTTWQVKDGTRPTNWQIALNLFVYAAGKADLRNRLNSPYIPETPGTPQRRMRVARLRYEGSWDPEPYAWERFGRYLRREVGIGVEPVVVDVGELKPETASIAHLVGNVTYTSSNAEVESLRKYVEAGGVVLVEACGGSELFNQSAAAMLARCFPNAKSAQIESTHELLNKRAPGMEDLSKPVLRPAAGVRAKGGFDVISAGKGHVIVSRLDLSTGLLGTNTWGIVGYEPAYAQGFMKNLVLWSSKVHAD